MKRFFSLMLILSTILLANCTRVAPTEVTVRVWETGEEKGEIDVLTTGRHGNCWYCSDYTFPTTEQNYRWTHKPEPKYGSDSDESLELQIQGSLCHVDVGIRFYIHSNPDHYEGLRKLVSKYPTNLNGIVDGLLYEIVRGVVKEAIQGKELNEVIDNFPEIMRTYVTKRVKLEAITYAIEVVEVYDISGVRLPQKLRDMIDETKEAAQSTKKLQEKADQEAIKNKMAVDKARSDSLADIIAANAQAQVNRILNNNTPNAANLTKAFIDKWDGHLAPGQNSIILDNIKRQ